MKSPVLGIDLGTTNSVVAVAGEERVDVLPGPDGRTLVPSVVSFHPNGDVLVGASARDRRLLDSQNTVFSVKRLIGRPYESIEVKRAKERFPFELTSSASGGVLVAARGETYTLSEISAFVLREIRSIAETALGMPCSRAVVTVPANFNELQRSATKAAGRVAGLEVLRILNEPTAAALAYGYGRGSRERIAIFDLGGGTFDVTILELAGEVFEVLATAGDTYLGGDDIDSLVAEQMAEAFLAHHRYDPRGDRQAYERLRAAAEWAKCQLSDESEVQLRIEELAYGEGGTSLDLTFGLTRQALEAMAMPLLSRAFDVCEEAMRVASVRPTQLDNVILVGGSTRMPLVHRMVEEYFGRAPLSNIDPDVVVAQGAALQGRALATSRAKSRLGRVTLRRVSAVRPSGIQEEVAPSPASDPRSAGSQPPPPPPPPLASGFTSPDEEPTLRKDSSRPLPPPPPPPRATGPAVLPRPSADATGLPPLPPPPPPPAPIMPSPSVVVGTSAPVGFDLPAPGPLAPEATGVGSLDPGAFAIEPAAPLAAPPQFDAGVAPSFDPSPATSSQLPGLPGPSGPPGVAPGFSPALTEPVAPPLLLDVTPLSLGVETVSGYCEHIIKRNSAIPTEQSRLFSTAQDDQDGVEVRICQGESRRLEENQQLGMVQLTGLPPGARGSVQIEVTFLLDADGTLAVRAVDQQTGQQQSIRIALIGGVDEERIAAMQQRVDAKYAGDA